MNKIIILALCLFFFCSKISAQEVKYNYDNNRATMYNALNLTNEQTKKICDFSDRAFCELARCQPDHESKPWNIANFINSISC